MSANSLRERAAFERGLESSSFSDENEAEIRGRLSRTGAAFDFGREKLRPNFGVDERRRLVCREHMKGEVLFVWKTLSLSL